MNSTFPRVSGSNLEGKRFELPKNFEGKLNIVIIAFRHKQQDLIDEWLPSLNDLVKSNPDLAYYELPTLSDSYSSVSQQIEGGMRAGIPDKDARERTITLYLDTKMFKQQLKIPDETTIYILLLNRNGQIIWRTEDGFTQQKLHDLTKAVKENIY